MKLIIENVDGAFYAYMESEDHFERVEPSRPTRLDPNILNNECSLEAQLGNHQHFVFDIKKPKGKKRSKK